jgi:hypothetical protein
MVHNNSFIFTHLSFFLSLFFKILILIILFFYPNFTGEKRVKSDKIREIMKSGRFNRMQKGRRFIALSLAEAATIRCIMHRRMYVYFLYFSFINFYL